MLKPVEEEDLSPIDETKIFYCSRTHSQLLQFVHELRRVNIPTPWWLAQDDTAGCRELGDHLNVKHLPLASRKNLCINSQVEKLGNVNAINERCLELQQPSTPKDKKCPFLPNRENESVLHAFRDHTLANIRDIEDLTRFGRGHGICPYYASRAAIKPSEVRGHLTRLSISKLRGLGCYTSISVTATKICTEGFGPVFEWSCRCN